MTPGPVEKPGYGEPWPALAVGFFWKCLRITEPQTLVFRPGKFGKCKLAKRGRYLRHRVHGGLMTQEHHRMVEAREPAVKNWKLLYTRGTKVKRARALGFEYHLSDDWATGPDDP